jgi:hypothetical protein
MKLRKLHSLSFAFVTLTLSLAVASATKHVPHLRPALGAHPTHVADGGAPVPPVPKRQSSYMIIADGGAPVPPLPPPPPPPSSAIPQLGLVASV